MKSRHRIYVWFSSAKLNKGCLPGSPVSLSGEPDAQRVFVTEGILKAEIAHQRTGLSEKEGKAGADPQRVREALRNL